jgi:prevent-host-death family protein
MAEVGLRTLRQDASAVVAAAAAGEEVTITDRGRPVAQVVPIAASRLAQLVAAGRARPPKRLWSELPSPAPCHHGRPPLSRALSEQRDGERS